MDQELFSNQLKRYKGEIPSYIVSAIKRIEHFKGEKTLKYLWDGCIVIKINIHVQFPTRVVSDSNIREYESVLIKFSDKYPDKAPQAYIDRLNFPKQEFAHLYISDNNSPAPICLIRGNIDEWFAEYEIEDYIKQIQMWFDYAACDELTTDNGQYEPLRLEGYLGSFTYDYDKLSSMIESGEETGFSLVLFHESTGKTESPSFIFCGFANTEEDLLNSFKDHLYLYNQKEFSKWKMGVICWNLKEQNDFNVNLPDSYKKLCSFAERYSLPLSQSIEQVFKKYPTFIKDVFPVILAIKRNKPLIGYNSKFQLINFYADISQSENKLSNDSCIHFSVHISPLTTTKARELSCINSDLGNLFIAGCGALGSKIVMHLIRNGHTDMTLCDGDKLLSHNLVRNSLMPDNLGKNKALALKQVLEQFYKHEVLNKIIVIPHMVGEEELKLAENSDCLLDFTASKAFLNFLVKSDTPLPCKVIKAAIFDDGNLGLLLTEGKNRNPRIDDLLILFYDQYKECQFVSDYLKKEYRRSRSDSSIVNVGVGCNSETVKLADETVSFHSALFCRKIKEELSPAEKNGECGRVFMSVLSDSEQPFSNQKKFDPLVVFEKDGWQIRIKQTVIDDIKEEMFAACPYETGGVLIGIINKKRKVIHVTDIIEAPSDSVSSPTSFIRGKERLKENLNSIKDASGQMFGYVGEWHSHPNGPEKLSLIDMAEVRKHLEEFRSLDNPVPLLMLLLTPEMIRPNVFE